MTTIEQLKTTLGSSFCLYIKAESFHWNVEGDNFVQLHSLFGEVYEAAYDAIDPLGEYIRIMDAYAPSTLSRMIALSVIDEQDRVPKADLMVSELKADCEIMEKCYKLLFDAATSEGEDGIANFAAGQMDQFGKMCWKLRVFGKKSRV